MCTHGSRGERCSTSDGVVLVTVYYIFSMQCNKFSDFMYTVMCRKKIVGLVSSEPLKL